MELRKAIISCLERSIDYITEQVQELVEHADETDLEELTVEFNCLKRYKTALKILQEGRSVVLALDSLTKDEVGNLLTDVEELE